MNRNDESLHAFEEWWATQGARILDERLRENNQGGCELDAFQAGAEWLSESCATMVANYANEVSHSVHAHVIRVVCNMLAERIRKRGGAQ